ncbi:MAG: fasciclin domain-containing protein [Draconibacterium sp.]
MKLKNIIVNLWVLVLVTQLVGCQDQWDEHYKNKDKNGTSSGSNAGIIYKLSTMSECSEFYNAIVEYNIDKLVKDNSIYTVLAPTNENFDIEAIPEDMREKYLLMHFTNGKFISNQLDSKRLQMFSTKYLNFRNSNGVIVIDNYADIITADIDEPNGVIHTIDTTLVYKPNVYEYMYEEFPFLADHFDSKIVEEFDEENSVPTGAFNDDGQTIYDSAWVDVNTFLEDVADLTDEQSQYTLIIPTQEVVNQSLENDVSSYFGGIDKVPDIIYKSILDGIIGNAVFPNAYTFDELPDEMVSVTYNNQVIDKEAIFEKDAELSNGVLHKTSKLEIDNSSFLKTIQFYFKDYVNQDREDGSLDFYVENFNEVEGDNRYWDVSDHSAEATAPNILFSNQNNIVSWTNYFVEGEWIEFEIPNVLKTTYEFWFDPKGAFYRPQYRVQFRNEDGTWEDEQFEFRSDTARPGKVIGTITFESFGNKTVRFTSIPGGTSRPTTTSLYELRLIPVTN